MLINICTLSDNNYAQHLGVMIASVLLSSEKTDELKFHVLDGGISALNKDYIERLKKLKPFEIKYYLVDNSDLKDCPATYLPIASYYNFLPQKYLTDVEKIVFLDSDMIVMQSLAELYATDLGGKVIAGSEDPISRDNMIRLGIPAAYFYFNTGTMIMDLQAWREQDIFSQLLQYVADYPEKITFMDQDILNDVLYEKSLRLPLKWNSIHYPYGHTYADSGEYEDALKHPAIIHYAMKDKPWLLDSKVLRREEYWKVFRQTPWYNFKDLAGWFVVSAVKLSLKKVRQFLKFRFLIKPLEKMIKSKHKK